MKKGFTLLELLIVIAILSILGAIIIFVLNPAETLKKARDAQRITDLSSIKNALGIYLTTKTSISLDGQTDSSANTKCMGGTSQDTIWYSLDSSTLSISDTTLGAGTSVNLSAQISTSTQLGYVDGYGWIPVNLSSLVGGSPISAFPIDPVNTIASASDVRYTDLVYRYSCKASTLGFEVDARFESDAYTVENNKMLRDSGNNVELYEAGTDLTILPYSATNQF